MSPLTATGSRGPRGAPQDRLAMFCLLLAACGVGLVMASDGGPPPTGGASIEEAMRRGERLFRKGMLPTGEPVEGVVQGDIPISGRMFSCSSCHLRSGLGTIEGGVVTLPTNGEWLFKPLEGEDMPTSLRDRVSAELRAPRQRPAYTDETLARVLRTGVDPAGRILSPSMPRYRIEDDVLAQFMHYLKNLSSTPAPGVTDTELRFATVIADDVAPELGDAVFMALQAHARDRNSQTRAQQRRSSTAPFYKWDSYTSYRTIILDRWNLVGPRSTWRAQLEAYQKAKPVFALLGGISSGEWEPIHEFCEANRIPNLLPLTRFPSISDSDWYSLYFSKGWYQEGETVARYIRSLPGDLRKIPVVQVFRPTAEGRMLARGLRETRTLLGQAPAVEKPIGAGGTLDEAPWNEIASADGRSILVLWLDAGDLEAFGRLASAATIPQRIFLSAELLGRQYDAIPTSLRGRTYLTYPYGLPQEEKRSGLVARSWMEARNIRIDDDVMNSQLYFTGWMLSGVIKEMRSEFYRDYLLDLVDMMRDEYYSIGCYPRLSFGPGQRYASKGCYIVQVSDNDPPALIPRSDWVVH